MASSSSSTCVRHAPPAAGSNRGSTRKHHLLVPPQALLTGQMSVLEARWPKMCACAVLCSLWGGDTLVPSAQSQHKSQHSPSTVSAQSQHSHSISPRSHKVARYKCTPSRPLTVSHSSRKSQHSHRIGTAQAQHNHSHAKQTAHVVALFVEL